MGILEGKVAVVPCARRGVGAAIVRSLAEAGAAEVVTYLKSESCAEEVVRDIRKSGGDALAYCADVTDEAAGGEVVRAAADAFGAVDVLVNNALPDYRFGLVARKDLEHIGWDDYLQQLGALRGALYCAQAVVLGMVENGGGRIGPQRASCAGGGHRPAREPRARPRRSDHGRSHRGIGALARAAGGRGRHSELQGERDQARPARLESVVRVPAEG